MPPKQSVVNATWLAAVVPLVLATLLPVQAGAEGAIRVGRLGLLPTVHGYRVDGKVLVPLRGIAEWLGAEVDYERPRIAVAVGTRRVRLTLGSTTATVDGRAVTLATPPKLYGGVTCVPLRFVGEGLGAEVSYHSAYHDPLVEKVAGLPFVQVSVPSRSCKVIVHAVDPASVAGIVMANEERLRAGGFGWRYCTDWVFECDSRLSPDYVWSSATYFWEQGWAGSEFSFLQQGDEGSVWRRKGGRWEHAGSVGMDDRWDEDLVAGGVPRHIVQEMKRWSGKD